MNIATLALGSVFPPWVNVLLAIGAALALGQLISLIRRRRAERPERLSDEQRMPDSPAKIPFFQEATWVPYSQTARSVHATPRVVEALWERWEIAPTIGQHLVDQPACLAVTGQQEVEVAAGSTGVWIIAENPVLVTFAHAGGHLFASFKPVKEAKTRLIIAAGTVRPKI